MPLARVVRAIPERLEHLRQQTGPRLSGSLVPALDAGYGVAADLLGVVAGEDARPRRPAAGGVVELGEPQAVGGETVEVRRGDLAAIAAGVGVAQIVREDQQDIRPGRLGGRR